MLEAMRLLKQAEIPLKRTVKMVLWGGEEQVFAGSKFYTESDIGDFTTKKKGPVNPKVSAYLNLDNGAGKIRGIYLHGNHEISKYFSEYLALFPESKTMTLQNANQTDHELFDYFNVPAFQFIQDPLDYMSAIHHTNMDVYEYAPMQDIKYNSVLVAYLVYKIANEETLLPRKPYNNPIPSRKGNTTFNLNGYEDAKKVFLIGDFNQWNLFGTPMYKTENGWECKIDLPPGKYYYKFYVDNHWTADPSTPVEELAQDGKGHGGLTIKLVN
jgi:hypothetical protein